MEESPIHVALREALVNLLMHADYAESDASLILRSPQGYLFRNPGSPRVPENDMLIGNRSQPRNPGLAFMFRQIGLAEEAGTGIPKIVQVWRELGFDLPEIHPGTDRYEFTLGLRYAHLLSEDDRIWLQSLSDHWTEEEQIALVLARHEGSVDNLRLRRMAGLHPTDATAFLGRLRDRGLLEIQGSGRGAYYRLASELLSPEKTIPAGEQAQAGISRELWAELREIARPIHGKSTPAKKRDPVVVGLCTREPLSLGELAELLGKTENTMRGIIQPLIHSGQLQYLYPERVTHPEQRYVAAEGTDTILQDADTRAGTRLS